MAKLYGEIAKSALLTLDKSFSRALGQPLDASEVYYSLAAAKAYAATPAAYIGQKIVVIEDGKVYHYSVEDAAGTLKELGVRPIGDGESIDVDENGNISIHGFDALTNEHIGYLPRVKKVVDKEATYKTIEATKDEVATVTLPKKVNTINIPALGLVTDVEVTSIATYRPGSEVPRNLIESDYSVFLDGDKLHITLAQETELDRLAVNYTYTYSTRTIAVPEESHLEIEWAPISAIVEGDTNTITQVVGTIGEESFVTHTHNEATDTHTYTIDLSPVTNRLDVLEGDADKEGSVAYQVAEGVITAKGYVDNLEERLDGTLDPITVKKAEDAEKLGGKAASEYATAEGLNELAQDYAEFNAAVITGTFNG